MQVIKKTALKTCIFISEFSVLVPYVVEITFFFFFKFLLVCDMFIVEDLLCRHNFYIK